jgi:hypothetical protein
MPSSTEDPSPSLCNVTPDGSDEHKKVVRQEVYRIDRFEDRGPVRTLPYRATKDN